MTNAAIQDLSQDEERRSPAVSLAEVLAACHELEIAGTPITRRSVREKLGRGSMTTIHNGVSQYEGRQSAVPPTIDLTPEDRNVIADLGARALAVAEERVERVLAQREAALQHQIAAANARADDAVAAAEVMIGEAQRHTLEALATSEAAKLERDLALSEAEEMKQYALRLEGQLTLLTADREKMAAHGDAIEGELLKAKTQLSAEAALRRRCEADLAASADNLRAFQAEHAKQILVQAEHISRVKEALAVEQGRLVELTEQRLRFSEAIERLENELSLRNAALSQTRADLAIAGTALAGRDQSLQELTAALSAEQAQTQQLNRILIALGEHTEAVRSLEASISAAKPQDESHVPTSEHGQ